MPEVERTETVSIVPRGGPWPVPPLDPNLARLDRGATVGRYVVLGAVGEGGMGVVYAGYDPELDRKVALKVLRPERAASSGGASDRARLLREAQATARLSHPNVVAVYDAGTFGDQVFIAMEFVEGRTLREWLQEGPPSWREIVALFGLAGQGLAAAHAAGLVHRDFKTENVLIGTDGRVRVGDFGLARPAGNAEITTGEPSPSGSGGILGNPVTQCGVALGTPAYMSPEQLRGASADARSDQFSFCVSLYEALYGERPFAGTNTQEVMAAVQTGTVKEEPVDSRVPRRLRAALLRGLRAEPEQRHSSMEELLRELERDPAIRRRRWLLAAGVLVAAGAVSSSLGYFQARRGQLCQGGQEKVAAVWNSAKKEQVRAAFVATRLPFASTAWIRIGTALDRYGRDWAGMRRAACEATRVRGEQSETLLDRQMLCLDQRLQQVDALVGVLSRADAQVVERASDSLRALDSLALCANPSALLGKEPLPADPALRARVRQVQTRLARARALQEAGKIPAALALAREGDRQAAALPYKPLEGEAAFVFGDLLENAGEFKASERTLYRALSAAEAGRDDLLKARCWKKLVYTLGYRQGSYEMAHRSARLAEAALARAGGDPAAEAAILDAEASVFRLEGEPAEALRRNERSLVIAEKHGLADMIFTNLSNIGGVYHERGDYEQALQFFRRALAHAEARKGSLHPETTSLYFNVGSAFLELKRYGEAEKYFRRSLIQREQLLGKEHPDVAESLGALGVLWDRRGHPDRAIPFNEQALRIYTRNAPGSFQWALAKNNLAEGLRKVGRYDEALGHLREALDTLVHSGHPDGLLTAGLLNSLGMAYLDQGRPREAVPFLEKEVAICRESAPPEWHAEAQFALAQALWGVGESRGRAVRLAREARETFLSLQPAEHAALVEVEAWLDRNGKAREVPLG